jgi:hypothetical protein
MALAGVALPLGLLTQASLPLVEPGAYATRNPADFTKPRFELACRVADRSRAWRTVRLDITGGQGFFEQPEYPGSSYVRLTTRVLSVKQDRHGLFRQVAQRTRFGTNEARLEGRDGAGVEVSFDPPGKFDLVTLVREGPYVPDRRPEAVHTGFCDAKEIAQQPLSRAETDAILRKCPEGKCR